MKFRFSSEFFAGNRQRLRELFTGTAPIVVSANGLLQRGADSTFKFSQDANFWYLTGIEEPDVLLVMERDKEYLIVPSRSSVRQAFDGVVEYGPLSKISGVKKVYDEKEGWDILSSRLQKVKHAATLAVPPKYVEQYGMYTNPARAAIIKKLKTINADLELLDINQHLGRQRMIKQPCEIESIQAAVDITVSTLKETMKHSKLHKYTHEYQLEAEITRGFRSRGANGHAFEPIIASGKRACTLHSVQNNGEIHGNELIVIDVGADVNNYSADLTRTVSVGNISKRQQNIFEAVLEVQNFALELLQPGTLLKEYEKKVEVFMGEKLRELGLIKTISHDEVRRYYPHATSHFLGLNTHDVGDYDRPLEPGVVITVEPGIYIHEEAIGIRLEDDILITKKGNKNLSAKLPKALK